MARQWSRVLEDLLDKRRGALVGYAYVFTGDVSSAEDVVHDAIVRTFSKPRHIHTVEEAEAYVRRAIATTSFNASTRRRRFAERAHLLVRSHDAPGIDEGVGARDATHQALLALSPRERECVVLRYYEDLSVAGIAEALRIAEGSVKRYLSDGIDKLRAEFGDDFVPADGGRERADVTGRRSKEGRR
jgi:RNA polymerase sigma-70 factor (ECF subfamily)